MAAAGQPSRRSGLRGAAWRRNSAPASAEGAWASRRVERFALVVDRHGEAERRTRRPPRAAAACSAAGAQRNATFPPEQLEICRHLPVPPHVRRGAPARRVPNSGTSRDLTQQLETALDRGDTHAIATLALKLLHALPRSRTATLDAWQDALRREWDARADDVTPHVLGTDDAPVAWASLDVKAQLDLLHALCEWQLERPDRLRRLVGTDEDAVSWRVDPAGWDREGNTYWLFDDNRLWVQRAPPKPKKRKAPAPKRAAKKRAAPPPPPPRRGGRRSSRLSRDSEWEEVPPEILRPEDVFDSGSELSNPPSEDEQEDGSFVEFETLCISLEDWQRFLERFATSKHPDERSLYNYLAKEVYPRVEEVMLAEQRRQALEEAMQHRKRSSRIAMKESEREERERELNEALAAREAAAAALAAERERLAREEAERLARRSREDRLRDREERILARERRFQERSRSHTPMAGGTQDTEKPAMEPPSDTDWHLRCEVCGMDAHNPPGDDSVVACERCGVWQHTECWDRRDRNAGRAPRDWEKVDFVCSACAAQAEASLPQPPTSLDAAPTPVKADVDAHDAPLPAAVPAMPTQPAPLSFAGALPGASSMAAPSHVPGPAVPPSALPGTAPGPLSAPTASSMGSDAPYAHPNTPLARPAWPPATSTTAPTGTPPPSGAPQVRSAPAYSPPLGMRNLSSPGSFPMRKNTAPSPLSGAMSPGTSVPHLHLNPDAQSSAHPP